jgi:hypothetical protein
MKKTLTLLTASVFVLVILLAGACSNSTKQEAEGEPKAIPETDTITSEDFPKILVDDRKKGISLEDTVIGCKRHLLMQNVSHTGSRGEEVVDSLYTDVYYGDIIYWARDRESPIKVHHVRIIKAMTWNTIDTCIVASEDTEFRGAFKLEIPSTADTGLVKYEIIFEDADKAFWCIDPYLRIKGTKQ